MFPSSDSRNQICTGGSQDIRNISSLFPVSPGLAVARWKESSQFLNILDLNGRG
jgi:hypothetical protein